MSRPLVLLHGFTGSGESWRRVVDALPPGRAVHTPNLLGHGDQASRANDPKDFQSEVRRLAGELRAAELAPLHLVGYSLGGRVALGLLVEFPELFCRATLIGTSPGLTSQDERMKRGARDEAWALKLESQGLESFLEAWQAQPLFASQADLPADVRETQRRQRLGHRARDLARAMRVLSASQMPDYRPALARIEIPVDLVVGELDGKFRALARDMKERLPDATLDVVPGVGHNVVLEAPRTIAELLARRG